MPPTGTTRASGHNIYIYIYVLYLHIYISVYIYATNRYYKGFGTNLVKVVPTSARVPPPLWPRAGSTPSWNRDPSAALCPLASAAAGEPLVQ